jgi:hypothetical protein
MRDEAKRIWNLHVFGDNLRSDAVRYIKKCAEDNGYKIVISKALDIIEKYCI